MPRTSLALACSSAFFAGAFCSAQSPEITRMTPYSGSTGESVSFTLEGKNLIAPKALRTNFGASFTWPDAEAPETGGGGAKSTSHGSSVGGTLTLPPEPTAPSGFLHLITATGLSNPLLFLVDELPVLRKNPPRNPGSFLESTIPHAFAGYTNTAEASLFQIHLKQGASVTAEVYAVRLGSKLDPHLRILDSAGKVCARDDDTPGLGGDCRLRFCAPQTGTYRVELRDSAFKGGPDYFYHLRLADFPLVESVYPPVAEAGSEQLFWALHSGGVHGAGPENAVPPVRLQMPSHPTATVTVPFRFSPQGTAALCSVRASDVPVIVESLEHPAPAPVLTKTCIVAGRLATPAEADAYHLDLHKDERVVVTSLTREIGSAATLYFSLTSSEGSVIASNDSGGPNADADLPLSFKVSKDGRYTLRVEDVARRGTPALTYAARVDLNPAPFELNVASPRFVAPVGGSFQTKITAQRTGTGEPIHITLESADHSPLPEGIRLADHVIEKGKNETLLRVFLPVGLSPNTLRHIQFRGSASEKGRPASTTASWKSTNKKNNAQSADSFTAALDAMPQPPRLLTESFGLCVGPDTPDFFQLETLDRGALLPRGLGRSQFVLRQTALDKAFKDNAQIRFENLPAGVVIKSDRGRGGRVPGQVDFVCDVEGPVQPPQDKLVFDIVADAEFKGASKQVRLKAVPLQVVDPVEITLRVTPSPLLPASGGTLHVHVVRHDAAHPAPVTLSAEVVPPGVALPQTIPTVPADKDQLDIPITVGPGTGDGIKPGAHSLRLRAASTLGKESVSTLSEPLPIEIKR